MTNEIEELKTCPFCGSTNIKQGGDDKVVGAWCENCQAVGPSGYLTINGDFEWNTRPAPKVKPLVWEGFISGPYEVTCKEAGIISLHNHASRDEGGCSEYLMGGYLPLVSLVDLKDCAQADYERRILSALE